VPASSSSVDAAHQIALKVTCNRELCTGGDRSCRHVELAILDEGASYETGDHVAIFPDNDGEQVAALAARLDVDLDTWVSLTDRDGLAPFPCPCTLRDALTKYLDINAAPRRALLVALSEMATSPAEKVRNDTTKYKECVCERGRGLLVRVGRGGGAKRGGWSERGGVAAGE
jgi:NADPH-ferrihemoprotein reductase